MNILNKISIKNLKLNRKRTVGTVIGIILSVALICAVATMAQSFKQTLIQNAINEMGYYHLAIEDVSKEQIQTLKNNRDINDVNVVSQIGYSKYDTPNKIKPYLNLYSFDEDAYNNLSLKTIEGRFPNNSNEIIISKSVANNPKTKYKVGDKITLDIGKRYLEGELIEKGEYIPYDKRVDSEGNKLENIEETIDVEITKEFTIVGIMEDCSNLINSYNEAGELVITSKMDTNEFGVFLSLKKPTEYKTSISQILGAKNYNEISVGSQDLKYQEFDINRELLRWEAFAFSDSTVSMLYSVVAVVIFIILFTSVFCIRNSFAISTTEKIKMYGMLSSIGATKKQIKKSVIFEGLALGVIGIPLGIIFGILAVFILIQVVNLLLGNFLLSHVDGMVFSVSIVSILLSVVLGFVTIYLSAIASARKAAKVSPIEQLRNSDEIKIKDKKLKTPKIITKFFKIGGTLAYKNLKRSKKKYRTTIISLTVSIFIFITMNSFLTNMFNMTGVYYQNYDYNIKVSSRATDLSKGKEEVDKILSLENIDSSSILYRDTKNGYVEVKDESKINKSESKFGDSYKDPTTGKEIMAMQIVGLNSDSFKKYVQQIGSNYEDVKAKGILCDKYILYDGESGKGRDVRTYTYQENDIINGILNKEEVNIPVGAVTDTKPQGLENFFNDGGYLILNIDNYKNIDFAVSYIIINSSDPNKLEKDIENLNLSVTIFNLAEEAKRENSMVVVINIFLYGFIAVITLIGVTNIFNTITSNIELRQKEFAMLKSIGMTKKEFNKMINLETIFYSTKALIYGIILGLLGTFAMYKAFAVKIDSGMYIPYMPIIISIICVFILVFIIMKYSINKVNKQNTIETIRKENI